uniref:ATP synthase subunit a n=1 Tax=Donax semistriatus TaxID=3074273 RepID=A0A286NT34_9BIVA|nr:ATP synthase F0 subunit 6 [Donax semistriatus]ATA66381.1 ATP synthase F0 subunit 6 [Donax semistriatus]
MLADAFSMFDYGGTFNLISIVSWVCTFFSMLFVLLNMDRWVSGNYLVLIFSNLSAFFSKQVLNSSRMVFGFGFFCVSLFIYLSFVGMYSIFPYTFCLTAHFSHNFCISMVMWFSTIILNFTISMNNFLSHFTPGGLPWYGAAPVAVFEMISNLSRLITLGARLTMNMIAGKLLLCVGSAFFGAMGLNNMLFGLGGICFLLLLLALTAWEMIVGIIQAYIFTFLSVTYVDEAPVSVSG